MDMDNGPNDSTAPVNTTGLDMETLLQQFNCMGTTDKDELIQQLQKLLGSHMNYNTAEFFLDMNNWNLQAAICSYLDIDSPNQLPSMALVSDPVASETESIEPSVGFFKVWHIYNNGTDAWPEGCYAQCSDGDNFGASRVNVAALQPGEGTQLMVYLTSPSVPGIYQSKWRLCTPKGAYFGDPMWAILTVVEEGTIALTQQLSHFTELGASLSTNTLPNHNPFVQQRSPLDRIDDSAPPDGTDSSMC